MAFISNRLGVVGQINSRDITEHFEISEPQASSDFRTFEREHPGAMRYDSRAKAYVSTMNDGATATQRDAYGKIISKRKD